MTITPVMNMKRKLLMLIISRVLMKIACNPSYVSCRIGTSERLISSSGQSADRAGWSPAMSTEPIMKQNPPNHLAREKSPYLQQHAHNPVDWYPWGDEAFRRAAEEHKPVFLSIGYATCHWCHVMAHESFEDPGIADILNTGFIAVKVDREERPDIDSVYMTACQQMTGQGGWPLTIIMTPDKKPFFAGTYLPRTTRAGMRGLSELLRNVIRLWQEAAGCAGFLGRRTHRPARQRPVPYLMRGKRISPCSATGMTNSSCHSIPERGIRASTEVPDTDRTLIPPALLETDRVRPGTPHG